MSYAFSAYFAGLVVDYLSQDTQLPTPPTNLYVTLYDANGNELSSSLTNARAETATPTDWDVVGTSFENNSEISLGEAASTLEDVTDAALFDAETGGNLLLRGELDDAPFNIANGTEFRLNVGDISADILDYSEQP